MTEIEITPEIKPKTYNLDELACLVSHPPCDNYYTLLQNSPSCQLLEVVTFDQMMQRFFWEIKSYLVNTLVTTLFVEKPGYTASVYKVKKNNNVGAE